MLLSRHPGWMEKATFRFLRFFRSIIQRLFLGIKVYALVGKAGTGKSFRAQLVARTHGISTIIDDGLLIMGTQILGGSSAKDEKLPYSAVRRAIFADPEHARQVRDLLKEHPAKKILVLGTSDRMIRAIVERLGLPLPYRTVYIEEVASQMEIDMAVHSRRNSGKHIIPVPVVEIQKRPRNLLMVPINVLLNRGLKLRRMKFEKTIVRPEFSNRGRVRVTREALSTMVAHCLDEFDPDIRLNRVIIDDDDPAHHIEVMVSTPREMRLGGRLHSLQQYLLQSLELYGGMDIGTLDVTVSGVYAADVVEEGE